MYQRELEELVIGARRVYAAAVRRGELVRQPCEVCGKPNSEGHHEDYTRPLVVHWLCPDHHRARHYQIRRRNPWFPARVPELRVEALPASLRLSEAARLLDMRYDNLASYRRRGLIEGVQLGRRRTTWGVTREELLRFVETARAEVQE